MNLIDSQVRYVLYAEVATLTLDKTTQTLSVECAWAVQAGQELERFSGAELSLSLSLLDHYGASHEDGGCHFEPGISAAIKFILHPPDTFEKSEDATAWRRIKAVGLETMP